MSPDVAIARTIPNNAVDWTARPGVLAVALDAGFGETANPTSTVDCRRDDDRQAHDNRAHYDRKRRILVIFDFFSQ